MIDVLKLEIKFISEVISTDPFILFCKNCINYFLISCFLLKYQAFLDFYLFIYFLTKSGQVHWSQHCISLFAIQSVHLDQKPDLKQKLEIILSNRNT